MPNTNQDRKKIADVVRRLRHRTVLNIRSGGFARLLRKMSATRR